MDGLGILLDAAIIIANITLIIIVVKNRRGK